VKSSTASDYENVISFVNFMIDYHNRIIDECRAYKCESMKKDVEIANLKEKLRQTNNNAQIKLHVANITRLINDHRQNVSTAQQNLEMTEQKDSHQHENSDKDSIASSSDVTAIEDDQPECKDGIKHDKQTNGGLLLEDAEPNFKSMVDSKGICKCGQKKDSRTGPFTCSKKDIERYVRHCYHGKGVHRNYCKSNGLPMPKRSWQ